MGAEDNYTLALTLAANDTNLRTTLASAGRSIDQFSRDSLLRLQENQLKVERSTRDLVSAQKQFGKGSLEARTAANQLAQSQSRLEASTRKTNAESSKSASIFNAQTLALRTVQGLAVGVGYKLAQGFVEVSRDALNFEKNMRNVTSLLTSNGLTAQQLESQYRGLSSGILDIATTVPQSVNDLAKGLYEVVSAGIPAAKALDTLNASAKAASAGLSSTETSTNAITGVMNAYGASAGSATQISDVLFQTVNAGVISFEQLAQNIGDVIGVASASKVPIQDVGSALAAMTRAGIVPAEASTSLNRLITELIQPSDNLTRVYRSLGIQSGLTALQTDGLYGVMEKLRTATGGNAESTLSLFQDIRAARGAFALMSNDGKTYAETQNAISDANQRAGATERALAEQRKSLSFQLAQLRNQAEVFGLELFRDVTPALKVLVQGLAEATQFANDHRRVVELLAVLYAGRFVAGLEITKRVLNAAELAMLGFSRAQVAANSQFTILGTNATSEMGAVERSTTGASKAAGGLTALLGGTAMLGAMAGLAALAFAFEGATAKSEDLHKSVAKKFDLQSDKGITDAIADVQKKLQDAQAEQDKFLSNPAKFGNTGAQAAQHYGKEAQKASDEIAGLKKQQEELRISSGDVSTSVAALSGTMESSTAAIEAMDKATEDLKGQFQQWAGPTTAFQSALQDAQEAINEANKTSKSASSDSLKQRKADLKDQQKSELDALRAQKDNVSNRSKGGTDAINREITDLQRKQKAQRDDLAAQGKYADQSKATSKDVADSATVGIDAYIRKLKEQDDALQAFQQNLVTIASKYGTRVAQQLQGLGPEAASLIQEFANATGSKADQARKEIERNLDLTDLSSQIEIAMQLAQVAASKGADAVGSGAVQALKAHTSELAGVANQYGIDLTQVANPVLDALGLKRVDVTQTVHHEGSTGSIVLKKPTVVPKADGGLTEAHSAEIAPAGAWRVWAEPETGGEAYIPLADHKAQRSEDIWKQVGKLKGWSFGPFELFANGGFSGKLPFPPTVGTYPAAGEAQTVMDAMYTGVTKALQGAAAPGAAPGAGQVGTGWQAITAFLTGQHVPYQVTSTTGGGHAKNSLHYIGKAVDMVSGNMSQIYNALFAVGQNLQELIYSPAKVGIKNGKPVDIKSFYGDAVYAEHFSHVHAATYDNGGYLKPGYTVAYNGTGRNEPVFTGGQFDRLVDAVRSGGGAHVVVQGDLKSTEETARKVVRKLRR
jgi:TP901 family phage tail tape measure protein